MEPVIFVIMALALGAATEVKDTVHREVKTAYDHLRGILVRKYLGFDIAKLEKAPTNELYQTALMKKLLNDGINLDDEALMRAIHLIASTRSHSPELARRTGIDIDQLFPQGLPTGTGLPAGVNISGSSAGGNIIVEVHYHYLSESPTAQRQPELENIDRQNQESTKEALIELYLSQPYDSFDSIKQQSLLAAIHQLLRISNKVTIKYMGPGSTVVVLKLPNVLVSELAYLVRTGELSEFGVRDIRRVYNLTGANLQGSDLRGADLRRANMYGVNLEGADLREAKMNGVDLRRADLSGARLVWTDLSWADLEASRLVNAEMVRTDLRKANLVGAILSGSDLTKANLEEADLKQADMSSASLLGTYLARANLTDAVLFRARYDRQTVWPQGFAFWQHDTLGPDSTVEQMIAFIERKGEGELARLSAVRKLISAVNRETIGPVIYALTSRDAHLRRIAADLVGVYGGEQAVGPLIAALDDADLMVRSRTVRALERIGTDEAMAAVAAYKRRRRQ